MTAEKNSDTTEAIKESIISSDTIDISRITAAKLSILFYLLLAILSPLGLLVPPGWIDEGNAAATVVNIQENETVFRIGISLNILGQVSFLLAGLAFYVLFKDVDKFQARVLLLFVSVSVPMTIAFSVFHLGALHLIGDATYLTDLERDDLNALVVLLMNMYEFGIHLVEIFWGLWLIPLGLLFYKSNYIPRIFGILLIINGIFYSLGVFNWIILSEDYEVINTLIIIGEVIGEIPTILWLLIMGINVPEKRVRLWT